MYRKVTFQVIYFSVEGGRVLVLQQKINEEISTEIFVLKDPKMIQVIFGTIYPCMYMNESLRNRNPYL